jgi:hypothetical protein
MRARRASGVREGELVQRAEKLRDKVDPLLPRLTPDCNRDRFDKLREELERVREARDDERRLEKLSHWGEPMVRAYAELLKFYLDPKLPAILVASFPGGDVAFAPLGKAPREAQIAVQHYSDPERLMIGYLDWARKGYHFFATDTVLYCTGKSATPPKDFLEVELQRLPYRLQPVGKNGEYECPHLKAGQPVPRLTIQWPDAPFSASICRKCVKSDRQLLASLSEGIAVPDPERTFLLEVDLNVDCRGGPDCIHQNLPEVSRGARKRYFMGRFSDGEFLDAYRAEVEPRIHSVRGRLFVAGGVCYGSDPKAFLEALHPTPEERRALEGILPEVDHYFEIDQATGSQALEKLWHDHAEEIVAAIVPDEARAARLVKEARAAPGRVSDLLSRAARETREREVLQSLPRFEGLGREGLFADSVLRAYRSQGPRAAERQLIHALPPDGKERGLAFGFLVALQQEQPHVWQFTETERQFGTNLAPLAQRALAAPPDEYADALGSLLSAAGVASWRGAEAGPPASPGV